jgi:hypothetical protein
MMKKLRLALTCSVVLVGMGSASARADIFDFSFSGASDSGSGTFTAVPTSTPGEFMVTAIGGTTDGSSIASLFAVDTYPFAFGGADNLLYYPSAISVENVSPGYLDIYGISYALADGTDINLYFGVFSGVGTDVYNLIYGSNDTNDLLNNFTLVDISTPEPPSLLLFATGALGLFAFARHRVPNDRLCRSSCSG